MNNIEVRGLITKVERFFQNGENCGVTFRLSERYNENGERKYNTYLVTINSLESLGLTRDGFNESLDYIIIVNGFLKIKDYSLCSINCKSLQTVNKIGTNANSNHIKEYELIKDELSIQNAVDYIRGDNPIIRAEIARRGWFIDILKNDPDPLVRRNVAHHGVFLNEFVRDNNKVVVKAAIDRGKWALEWSNNFDEEVPLFDGSVIMLDDGESLRIEYAKICKKDDKNLRALQNDNSKKVRIELAKRNMANLMDPSWEVRAEMAKHKENMKFYLNDIDDRVVAELVAHEELLDLLMEEKREAVMVKLVSRGVRKDSWINGPMRVRRELAKDPKICDKFVNDRCWEVRREVAKSSKNMDTLEILKNDEFPEVRVQVSNRGFFLEDFKNDKSENVRKNVNIKTMFD